MEFADAVRRRRMVRGYEPDRPVERNVLEHCLDLAIRAPSAGHTQGHEFLVLDDITSRARFWSATAPAGDSAGVDRWLDGMRSAPTLVLCLSDREAYLDRYAETDKGWTDRLEERWPIPYWDVDTGMAAMILLLAAEDVGLGACFFGVPPERRAAVFAAFDIPERLRIVGVVSLGYRRAADDPKSPSLRRGRRPLREQLHYSRF